MTSSTAESWWAPAKARRTDGWSRLDAGLAPWWRSAALVALTMALLWLLRLSGPIDLRYDGGVYYMLGTSISTGAGYRLINEPGAPEGVQYPPVLPALVSVHQMLLGTTSPEVVGPALRLTFAGLSLALGWAVLALARRWLRASLALLATLLAVAQINTVLLSDLLFTETPFTLLAVVFVLVLTGPEEARRGWLAGILAAIAFFLRTAGIALLFAWVVEALMRGRWRLAGGRAVLAALPVVLWQAHVHRVESSDAYQTPAYAYQRAPYQYYNVSYATNLTLMDPFRPEAGEVSRGALLGRAVRQLGQIPPVVGELVSAPFGFWRWLLRGEREGSGEAAQLMNQAARFPLWVLAGLVGFGAWCLLRRGEWTLLALVGASIGLTCTTPWPGQFTRYLAPMTPFMVVAGLLGASVLYRQAREARVRLVRPALVGLLGVVVVVQVWAVGQTFRLRHYSPALVGGGEGVWAQKHFYRDRTWVDWERAMQWVRARAHPEAVVATTVPHLGYLETGLRTVMQPMEADPATNRALLEGVPVSYLVVDQLEFLDISARYARPAVTAPDSGWRLVHREGTAEVYAAPAVAAGGRR